MIERLLIANRGEIAIRIAQAAAELGMRSVAVHPVDDEASLHVRRADEARVLPGRGAGAYLDIEQLILAAKDSRCDAVHPGYGFLSENAAFARRCAEEGLVFVGPSPEVLELFGDKTRARRCAGESGVPLLEGTQGPTSCEQVVEFMSSLGEGAAVVIKAVAGGGGRGMRIVRSLDEVEAAYARCRSEAAAAFGNGDLYAERLLPRARHVEVQLVGDGAGAVSHLFDRDCSVQRQGQKLIEIAPSPALPADTRERLIDSALRLGRAGRLDNLATVEFLVDLDAPEGAAAIAFMEVNARIQVEHTVTEEVTGVDLVKTQLRIAGGATLSALGLAVAPPFPQGHAMQLRLNMETLDEQGRARPSGGSLTAFEIASGPGIRVDTHGYVGYRANPGYDSLLAKLVCRSAEGGLAAVIDKGARALGQFRIEGVQTNLPLLSALLARDELRTAALDTRFIERHAAVLSAQAATVAAPLRRVPDGGAALPVIHHPAGTEALVAPMTATVVALEVAPGELVARGQTVVVVEAMKMEHLVVADRAGRVHSLPAALRQTVDEGQPVAFIEPLDLADATRDEASAIDLDVLRPDLLEVVERHAITLDARRPEAVARRRRTGQRTARENVDSLCDPGSFAEYGALVVAAQRRTRPLQELIENTQADGMVTGIGSINGDRFDARRARAAVLAYDYTVFAGTQSYMNHRKSDRLLETAHAQRLPVVIFAEGGGGRPGVSDHLTAAGLSTMTFVRLAQLNGLVPLIGIVSGRCFAGNAALLGSCDVVIATRNANIGLGGPAMIEGGGLGVFRPEEIGPVDVQGPNGVIDVLVDDEPQAVEVARRYLAYFQGALSDWQAADQRTLRHLIPENRLRSYDVRRVIDALFDTGSVLELRSQFGIGILTALARIEGRPVGVIASNPRHLGGAIDADASDKVSRFMQLCDGHGLPIVSLCDTPGFMVGPEAERSAQVRRACRMFVTAASMRVPVFTVVLRKGYGLGAMAMGGGALHQSAFVVSWPTGEFGGMGLEGAVRLGHRRELEAIEDPEARRARFEELLAQSYEKGKAISMASFYEIDGVIDPNDTRWWLARGLEAVPPAPDAGRRRTMIDTW